MPSVENFRFSFILLFLFLLVQICRQRKSKMTTREKNRKGSQRKSIWLFMSLKKYLVEINLQYRHAFYVVVFKLNTTGGCRKSESSPTFFLLLSFCWRQTKSFLYSQEVMRFSFVISSQWRDPLTTKTFNILELMQKYLKDGTKLSPTHKFNSQKYQVW